MRLILALAVLSLAACGIKGDPQPVPSGGGTGLSVSGTAKIGVTYRSDS